jgi:hypothetical protein
MLRRLAQRMAWADSGDSGFLRDSLGNFMRRASAHKLPRGWLHLADGEITWELPCVLVTDAVDMPDEELHAILEKMGFPRVGLETQEMESVADGIEQLAVRPTDKDYLRGFLHYWRYQSFLPTLVEEKPVATALGGWRREVLETGAGTATVEHSDRDERIWRLSILDVMRMASADRLPLGWIFLDRREPKKKRQCLVVHDDVLNENSDEAGEQVVKEYGFPYSAFSTPAAIRLATALRELTPNPTDAQMLDGFRYYFDYLEAPTSLDANRQPPIANWTRRALVAGDHEFWTKLKDEPERPDKPCRRPGCTKGAIPLSVFCREHHFESIRKRPYPKSRYDLS